MKYSLSWLKELSGVGVTDEVVSLLNAKACEVKEVSGDVLDADILPNRPDLLSHVGMARELCALTGASFNARDGAVSAGAGDVPVEISDASACTRYSGLVVRGVRVGPSPDWLAGRLQSLGAKSINNVVDVMNIVMLETGQPLHAFDLAKLQGGIQVRRAKKGEHIKVLDDAGTEFTLTPDVPVIADRSGPVAIAGIKGGASTAVSDDTKDIFVEAACFVPAAIRMASRSLNLRTDASVRFSYGTAPELTVMALARASELLKEVAGGTADGSAADVYPHPRHPVHMVLDSGYVRSLLGADVSGDHISSILSGLGFGIEVEPPSEVQPRMKVIVPYWRLDISRSEDLVEEVGRMFGYENIPATAPVVRAFDERQWVKEEAEVPWDGYEFIRERQAFGRLLAGAGFSEAYNYSFISDELKNAFGLTKIHELAGPQSGEFKYLRPSLLCRLALSVRENFRYADSVRLFETGHRFPTGKPETSRIAIVLGNRKGDAELFYELKGVVDLLHEQMGIPDIVYDDTPPFAFETLMGWCAPGRGAEVKTGDGQPLGVVGILNPAIANRLKVKGTLAFAEFDLKALIGHAQKEREYEPLPKYPAVVRDISMLLNDDVRISRVLEVIQSADASGLVRDVDVVDIFVPTGKEKLKPEGDTPEYGRSVAVRIVYRSDERTLTDEEVAKAENVIKKALVDELDAQIR